MIDGRELVKFRTAQGWSLSDLSRQCGIHHLRLAQYERGTAKSMIPEHEAALAAVMTNPGAVPLTIRKPRAVVPSLSPPPSLTVSIDSCAEILIDHICSLDPTWRTRIQVMQAERGFTPLQALCTCVAYVLEQGLHMSVIQHEALQPSPWRRGEKMECPTCHVIYSPRYPNQPYCSNPCAEAARQLVAVG